MDINSFLNEKLLDFFTFNEDGYVIFFLIAGIYLFIMFLAFGIYAFIDSRKRGIHTLVAILIGLIVFIFNIPALILYIILRPSKTKAENEWEELERKFLSHEVDDFISCDACNTILSSEDLYCLNCGKQHRAKCSCGKLIESSWSFCPQCGKASIYYQKVKREISTATIESEKLNTDKAREVRKNRANLKYSAHGLFSQTKSLSAKLGASVASFGSGLKTFLSDNDSEDPKSSTVEITTNLNPYKSETRVLTQTNKAQNKKKKKAKKRRRR